MAKATILHVNGKKVSVAVPPETPLLYVLRNDLDERSPRFGCGLAQCGACAVQVNGQAVRTCVTPLSAVSGKSVTTLEGLSGDYVQRQKQPAGTLHPVQAAFIDLQATQCGYCINGWVMTAASGVTHDRTACPFTCTAHAPHCARPQPNRGLRSSRSLRNT